MNNGVITHCPRCGAALMLMPTVATTNYYGNSTLRFTFQHVDVEHKCEVAA